MAPAMLGLAEARFGKLVDSYEDEQLFYFAVASVTLHELEIFAQLLGNCNIEIGTDQDTENIHITVYK